MGETPRRSMTRYRFAIAQRLVEKTALAPLNPLPALREGRQSVALARVGFFGFNKQLSGHDMTMRLFHLTINSLFIA